MLDAGIGQHAFEIGLAEDEHGRHGHRDQAEEHQQIRLKAPSPAADQQRVRAEDGRNAQFNSAPESSAETTDGASLWASGSQVCSGARPIFVP